MVVVYVWVVQCPRPSQMEWKGREKEVCVGHTELPACPVPCLMPAGMKRAGTSMEQACTVQSKKRKCHAIFTL